MSAKLVTTLKQYRHDGTRWHFIFAQTAKRKGQCKVRHCKRPARVRVRADLYVETCATCITCNSRLFRANHQARDAYYVIKDRAKRRGQIFDITFEDFCAIPRFDEYIQRRGRGIDELHIDRVRVERGYVKGNLQVLTTAENLRKQREVDYATVPDPF